MSLATLKIRTSPNRHRGQRTFVGMTFRNRGMTLVELLVAMAIIATLAAIVYGTLSGAGETAREARTKQLITRLHTLLTDRYESYRDRRIDAPYDGTGQVLAGQRLHVLRTTMQMELPDRWSDITNALVKDLSPTDVADSDFNPDATSGPKSVAYRLTLSGENDVTDDSPVIDRTALNRLYLRQYAQLDTDDSDKIRQNQSAECLYLIIMNATGDGEARSMFKETDVADTDEDGALEFVDGWGNPIHFVRWPKGYTSVSSLTNNDSIDNHDPFDIFRVHTSDNLGTAQAEHQRSANRLVPLIYSAGPDEVYDIATTYFDENSGEYFRYESLPLSLGDGTLQSNGSFVSQTQLVLNPYQMLDAGNDIEVGDEMDADEFGIPNAGDGDPTGWTDNITNHNITAR